MKKQGKKSKLPVGLPVETPAANLELAGQPEGRLNVIDETRVVLLPVEPYKVFVYWEIAPQTFDAAERHPGERVLQAAAFLRFHDVTGTMPKKPAAQSNFDIQIDLAAGSWYVDLWSPDKTYFVELGFKSEDGRFLSIACSNTAEVPPDCTAVGTSSHQLQAAGAVKESALISQGSDEPFRSGGAQAGHATSTGGDGRKKKPRDKVNIRRPSGRGSGMPEKSAAGHTSRMTKEAVSIRNDGLSRSSLAGDRNIRFTDLAEMNERQFTRGLSSAGLSMSEYCE